MKPAQSKTGSPLCRSDSLAQGHAVWHVLDAVAAWCLYRFYAAETVGSGQAVPEPTAALAGEISMTEAIERAKIATRQYAKRQSTWFRNQLGPHWQRIGRADDAEAINFRPA